MADILEYGAMSQIYTRFNTENLANNLEWVSEYKSTFAKPKSNYVTLEDYISEEERISAAGLHVANNVSMYFAIKSKEADKVSISDGINTSLFLLEAAEKKDDLFIIRTTEIMPTSFGKTYFITLLNNDEVCHQITYSVNSYIAMTCEGQNQPLANLSKAICNYGKSAIAFNK